MDLWKLLIFGIILVGLFLVLEGTPEVPKLPEGLRVEESTFRHRPPTGGTKEELFGIYPVDAGFRVVSLLREGKRVVLEADLLYGPDWMPLAGTLTQRSPTEIRWLFTFGQEEVMVRRQVGPRETTETIPLAGPAFPVDRDLLGPWDALFRAGSPEYLLDVRQGALYKVSVSSPEPVNLRVLGRAFPAERLGVSWEEGMLWFYRQGELLIGMRGEESEAFLVEVLPEGIEEVP
ncbi:MAG: hypothetical protein ACUVQS_00125 [Candidatus Bipolaricaulaceae bacterium]